ncbi:capsular polysaccharide transport system permease protein [Methylobacillus rhizosphaerae]|uniref:Transport permease protein n=1 Tax=Methylobacillus rhizosphaerae TaxID=551994 RepID=A0A238XLD8_9PROT|nr:ABC transporter permease [Methylobacillus rhizosphaerae]SNR59757.1 capsular polysaccharide transport system permease protein [Methylobacillus rhizosphaerae]
MIKARSPLAITLAVWHAIFLREALGRLFDMRFAWFWLFMEPTCHIAFVAYVWRALRTHSVGGMDIIIWVLVGMLAFFLFRRTAVQTTYACDSNQPLFTYRQVKPFDTAIVRAGLEGFLMMVISIMILIIGAFFGHDTVPADPLMVIWILIGIWLFGLGYGLIGSVLMALVPEMEHVLKLIMLPLYLISGVIWPISSVPQPYLDLLMYNPMAHALELVRLGYFPYYHAVPGVSMSYLYGWAGASVLLGLLLYRRFAFQLVMK